MSPYVNPSFRFSNYQLTANLVSSSLSSWYYLETHSRHCIIAYVSLYVKNVRTFFFIITNSWF